MGDHTECFQVDYDPAAVSYESLLDLFWQSHDFTRPAWKTQYASLVLVSTEEQLAVARESAARMEELFGRPVATRIEHLDRFWRAEDYHQKYYLRNDSVLNAEMHSLYPDELRFTDSTAAARINGYAVGGPCARLERDLPELGVSDIAAQRLRARCV
jgi:peptide-methionine (S)-S-oxide reductase